MNKLSILILSIFSIKADSNLAILALAASELDDFIELGRPAYVGAIDEVFSDALDKEDDRSIIPEVYSDLDKKKLKDFEKLGNITIEEKVKESIADEVESSADELARTINTYLEFDF